MTKDDIKKALGCCSQLDIDCDACPYDELTPCIRTMCKDALNLITAQQREIERLKAENDKYAELFKMKDKDFFTITVEEWEKFKSGVLAQIKQEKIDVLNELKERTYRDSVYYPEVKYEHKYVHMDDIDELIKEIDK